MPLESKDDADDGLQGDRIAVVSDALTGWSLEEVLSALSALGVTALETQLGDTTHLPAIDPPAALDAARRIADAGIALCGVDAPVDRPLGHQGLDRVVDLANELGVGFVRIYPPLYDDLRHADAQLEAAARALGALRGRAADDLQLLLEPCHGSLTPSAELALRVLRESAVQGVGVVFDPANMVVEGHLRPELAVDLLGDYLCHVHAKNLLIERNGATWRSSTAALDGGHVDWVSVLACLARAGYRGWLSIDHLSGTATAQQLTCDVATLRRLARSANGERVPELEPADTAAVWPTNA
jgi:sugar phosphate isomerase/epimerase